MLRFCLVLPHAQQKFLFGKEAGFHAREISTLTASPFGPSKHWQRRFVKRDHAYPRLAPNSQSSAYSCTSSRCERAFVTFTLRHIFASHFFVLLKYILLSQMPRLRSDSHMKHVPVVLDLRCCAMTDMCKQHTVATRTLPSTHGLGFHCSV